MKKYELVVHLNGTDTNPYAKFGLKHNPFPQYQDLDMDMQMKIAALGGEPIKSVFDLRVRLDGFQDAFINACINRFVPGKLIVFGVRWNA